MKNKGVIVKERGAVSIFIVIFTALLVTIVTTSFIQIMLRNQQQATDNDLSQSAYDSAMAGVEDAKRALVQLRKCQLNVSMGGCSEFISKFSSANSDCEILNTLGTAAFVDGEVTVGGDAEAYDQAYTCVTMETETAAYDGKLLPNEGVVVPLKPVSNALGADNANSIEKVRISWFSKAKMDVPESVTTATIPSSVRLPDSSASWGINTPPMIRAQLMQFNKGSIKLADFDGGNSRTRLLYPFAGGGSDDFENDTRSRTSTNSPTPGGCVSNFSKLGEYACSVNVNLPSMPPGQSREAYLYLSGVYVQIQGFHYTVEMLNAGGGTINYYNVQPQVDSTGRAGDLFRRVRASVDISDAGVPTKYPKAAISTRNLCKEFFITNNASQYNGNGNSEDGACTP